MAVLPRPARRTASRRARGGGWVWAWLAAVGVVALGGCDASSAFPRGVAARTRWPPLRATRGRPGIAWSSALPSVAAAGDGAGDGAARGEVAPGTAALDGLAAPAPQLSDALACMRIVCRYLWPSGAHWAKARLVFSLSLLFAAKLCLVRVPFMLKRGIDALASPSHALAAAPLALFAVYGLSRMLYTALQELRYLVFVPIGQRAVRAFARDSFAHVHALGMAWHATSSTGETAQQLTRAHRAMTMLIRLTVFNIVPTLLELLLVVRMMGARYEPVFWLTSGGMCLAFVAWTLRVSERRAVVQARLNAHENTLQSTLFNSLVNHEAVGWFTNERFEVRRYDGVLSKIERTNVEAVRVISLLNIGQTALFAAALSLVMGAASARVFAGSMSIGDVTAINGVLLQLYTPLTSLSFTYQEIRQAIVDMGPVLQLHERGRAREAEAGARQLPPLRVTDGLVQFDDVTFAYPRPGALRGSAAASLGAQFGMLRNISFSVRRGQKVAIVGSSGSGKSTVLKLIGRFYEPLAGRVLIDGQDLARVDPASVRRAVSLVPQDTVLFDETVGFNIRYGNLSASDEQLCEASARAGLHDAIDAKPDGYETRVGERGGQMSGGERQRIAIARAMLCDAPVVLYDEHSSAMDSITEQGVGAALADFNRDKTVVVVAHKLSSVIDADEILVINHGEIVERGPHWQLLTNSTSLYANMFLDQLAAGHSAACDLDDEECLIATGQFERMAAHSMWDTPKLDLIGRQFAGFNDPDERMEAERVMSKFPG